MHLGLPFCAVLLFLALQSVQGFVCDQATAINGAGLVLPDSAVNDDYCDCMDGSDEPLTSACTNGVFACANQGFLAAEIHSGKVGDSICDCCDGSDEAPATCSNTCEAAALDFFKALKQRVSTSNRGVAELVKFMDNSPAIRRKLYNQLVLQEDLVTHTEQQFRQDEARIVEKPDFRQGSPDYRYLEQQQGKLQQLNRQYHQLLAANELSLGFQGEFLSLFNQCFQFQYNKTRYGHYGIEIDPYVMEVCPLQNATQYTVSEEDGSLGQARSLGTWNASETYYQQYRRHARGQDHETALSYYADIDPALREAHRLEGDLEPAPRVLRRRQSPNKPYQTTPKEDTDYAPHASFMVFSGGERCWNGPPRSAVVRMTCGVTTALINVEENGICRYEFTLETPAACSINLAKRLRQDLQQVQSTFYEYHHNDVFLPATPQVHDEL